MLFLTLIDVDLSPLQWVQVTANRCVGQASLGEVEKINQVLATLRCYS